MRDYRELGDIGREKFRNGLAKWSERTPADGCLIDNFAKKSLKRFDELACAVIHLSRLVVAVGRCGGEHHTAACPLLAQVIRSST